MKNKMISEELIDKVLAGEASAAEAEEVSSWLATDEGQWFLSSHMDCMLLADQPDLDRGGLVPTYDMYEAIQKRIRKRSRAMAFLQYGLAAALLFLLFVFIGGRYGLYPSDTLSEENTYVSRGKQMSVLFADGSKAIVNAGSHLSYPKRFGFSKRVVTLDGEAYFDIARNPMRPFIIRIGDAEVRVFGTQFNVKAYPEEETVTVGLESGKVSFRSGDSIDVDLTPGEMLSYNKSSQNYSVEKLDDITMLSAWKTDILCLDDTPLDEITAILSRLFDVDFQVTDERCLRYSCTLITPSTDLTQILDEIALITPIRFEKKGHVVAVLPD